MSMLPRKLISITNFVEDLKPPIIKHQSGIPKLVFTHCSTLYNTIKDWIKLQEKGTKICKGVSALKLHEYFDNVYPKSLGPLTESLVEIMDGMKNILEGIETVNKQLKAAALLQPKDDPVMNTWSASQISNHVEKIYQSMTMEYELKFCITENIAHCRDENLIEIYVSSWEQEVYLNISEANYLFIETGLPEIT